MIKVIIDTNFLLVPFQFNVDIFSEISRICDFNYKLYIFDKTIEELEKIIETGKGKDKRAAKLGLQMVKKFKISKIKTSKLVDDAIVDLCKKEKVIVATQDIGLRRRIKGKCKLIVLRKKSYLEFQL